MTNNGFGSSIPPMPCNVDTMPAEHPDPWSSLGRPTERIVGRDDRCRIVRNARARAQAIRRLYLVFWFIGSLLLAFLLVPLIALALSQSGQSLATSPGWPMSARRSGSASRQPSLTAGVAALLGIPLAYVLARSDVSAARKSSPRLSICRLPFRTPWPASLCLIVFGRQGVFGGPAGARRPAVLGHSRRRSSRPCCSSRSLHRERGADRFRSDRPRLEKVAALLVSARGHLCARHPAAGVARHHHRPHPDLTRARSANSARW